jgi:hypothetical protein
LYITEDFASPAVDRIINDPPHQKQAETIASDLIAHADRKFGLGTV